jgi:ribosomal protein L11 methyltransferase
MPKFFIEVTVSSDLALMEKLVGILSQLGFEGFWEDGLSLKCYIKGDRWNERMFAEIQTVVDCVARSSSSVTPRVSLRKLKDQNWNEQWEKTIRPIRVTDRIVLKPTWQTYNATPDQIVVTINPKMSFGTGYHETTRLVLRLMERYVKRGMQLLDVGTGTGVLAIAGIKLGASSAIGVDTDEWSYLNALENVELNHVEENAKIIKGDIGSVPQMTFDMIVANIQRNVIEEILHELKKRLTQQGILLLSGLLHSDEKDLRQRLRDSGFNVMEKLTENEWLAFAAYQSHAWNPES